jgi:hypothetical protein
MSDRTRITVTVPRWVKRALEEMAARDGVSVNRVAARAVAEKIGGPGAAAFFAERGKDGDVERAIAFLEGRSG